MDEKTRTVEGRIEVGNADGCLRAGMYVEAALASGRERTAVVVPASALQEFQSLPVVFVREGETTFRLRPVEIGDREGGLVEIVGGVSPGEWVVTAGGFLLKSELLKSSLADEHGHD
jgi:multidrug efflux pump subunit AcrA (membrane-fusion protein)